MDEQLLANLCKALGHPVRVKIFKTLIEQDACITGELASLMPVAQSTVSQHLKMMRELGLICGEIDGPRRSYCVNRNALEQLKTLVANL